MLIGARWQPLALGRPLARMRLQRVRFVGLIRAQRPAGGACGWGRAPLDPQPMAEAAVGDYAMMQGAFMHPAGGAFADR